MKLFFIIFLFFLNFKIYSQQLIYGFVTDDSGIVLPSVLVINTTSGEKIMTDIYGKFSIQAKENDDIRFVKKGFERSQRTIFGDTVFLQIMMIRAALDIEEVKIPQVKLSGDINEDSKKLARTDKTEQLQKDIGLPKAPEKPREKPVKVTKDILLPVLLGSLNVQAIYDVVSGKTRRQKNWYKYEDMHDNINWIKERLESDYFVKAEIPENKISEFLEFSILVKPEIISAVKAKNLSKVMILLEDTLPIYLDQSKS